MPELTLKWSQPYTEEVENKNCGDNPLLGLIAPTGNADKKVSEQIEEVFPAGLFIPDLTKTSLNSSVSAPAGTTTIAMEEHIVTPQDTAKADTKNIVSSGVTTNAHILFEQLSTRKEDVVLKLFDDMQIPVSETENEHNTHENMDKDYTHNTHAQPQACLAKTSCDLTLRDNFKKWEQTCESMIAVLQEAIGLEINNIAPGIKIPDSLSRSGIVGLDRDNGLKENTDEDLIDPKQGNSTTTSIIDMPDMAKQVIDSRMEYSRLKKAPDRLHPERALIKKLINTYKQESDDQTTVFSISYADFLDQLVMPIEGHASRQPITCINLNTATKTQKSQENEDSIRTRTFTSRDNNFGTLVPTDPPDMHYVKQTNTYIPFVGNVTLPSIKSLTRWFVQLDPRDAIRKIQVNKLTYAAHNCHPDMYENGMVDIQHREQMVAALG